MKYVEEGGGIRNMVTKESDKRKRKRKKRVERRNEDEDEYDYTINIANNNNIPFIKERNNAHKNAKENFFN